MFSSFSDNSFVKKKNENGKKKENKKEIRESKRNKEVRKEKKKTEDPLWHFDFLIFGL